MRYLPNADADRRHMLRAIGRASVDELFSDIPRDVLAAYRPLDLASRSELEVLDELTRYAETNEAAKRVSLLGGGIYDHYVPRLVGHILGRSEFYTA